MIIDINDSDYCTKLLEQVGQLTPNNRYDYQCVTTLGDISFVFFAVWVLVCISAVLGIGLYKETR